MALVLALSSALLHATFGALQKGRFDPWLTRGSIDFSLIVISLPVALFLVPWPQGIEWALLFGALVIHFFYKLGMALAYSRGAYTVVYPVVRGAGPLFAIIGAYLIFSETFTRVQWLGVGLLVGGIFAIAAINLRDVKVERPRLVAAIGIAFVTGILVAVYTTYDAYAIRNTADPLTFVAWFFLITALDFPPIAYVMWCRLQPRPDPWPLLRRGLIGAVVAWGSFGAVILATLVGHVGEAAVLRETSTVFAAVIGWLFLKERVGPARAGLMCLIAAGAVIVELGGRYG